MNTWKVNLFLSFVNENFNEYYSDLADVLLNVTTMRRAAATLSTSVTMYEIENAIHDVFLSKLPIREKAFKLMFQWLDTIEHQWVKSN